MAYQLALALGYASVSRMLRQMKRREWLEWQVFLSLEPLEGPRTAALVASVVQEMRNQARDTKRRPDPYTLEECLLRFGDDLPPAPKRAKNWKASKQAFLGAVMPDKSIKKRGGR